MGMTDPDQPILAARCPHCKKLSVPAFRPFCSKHCADIDLSRWLNGVYAIPVVEDDDEDGTPLTPS
jgi:uncharacterized protein